MAIRRPEAFDHYSVQLEEIEMHFVREGKGPPLLLLHGWPGFWWDWHMNIGPLATTFDVISADMRGYGDSEKPDLSRVELFHTDRVVEDVAQLLDRLGLEKAYIAGHDYSALVVHKFLRKYREKVIKAVIINPIVPGFNKRYMSPGHFAESWYAMFHQLDLAVEVVSSSRAACKAYYKHFLSHWSSNKDLFTNEEIEIYTDNFMKPGNIHGGFNFYRAGRQGSWTKLDRTISDCPTCFLQGLDDPIIPSAWTDLVASWYNDYTIEYVAGAGHFLMREKPELVNERIRKAFLG